VGIAAEGGKMNVPSESRTDSRAKILERVRAATRTTANTSDLAAAYAGLPRTYVRAGRMSADERIALMIERLREYDADVVETSPDGLAAAIAKQLKASGRRRFVVPEGLPAAWMADGFEWKIDRGLSAAEIETCEGVVTGSFCGIADSGTIVLHHSTMEGRRVISLLPDWHLCVLRTSQVVETLPEYFDRCEQPPVLATYISGPSATADIEMTRIKGVHGPRFLNVMVVHDVGAELTMKITE
jgi:L-lactate dehydrogenase complex protein LldG